MVGTNIENPSTNKLLAKAISIFIRKYTDAYAEDHRYILKPISWALYETWKIVNILEVSRFPDTTEK